MNPASGRWSEAAPLPKARDHMAVVAAEGKIYGCLRLRGGAERGDRSPAVAVKASGKHAAGEHIEKLPELFRRPRRAHALRLIDDRALTCNCERRAGEATFPSAQSRTTLTVPAYSG